MQDIVDLIDRCRSGEQDAFAALFERYKNLVYRIAYLTLNNQADAEDALQEVFIRVYSSLANFDPAKGAFTTWLYRITMYHCLNRRRADRLEVEPLDENVLEISDDTLPIGQIDLDGILPAIDHLSEKQRAVLVLRYYADLPYAEIAEVLGIPLGTVKSRLDLALKTLRAALEKPPSITSTVPAKEVTHGM
ncbi:MAG TPA: RNA polymerase sigma factor [Phototrophicaceae bacterium]|nr:RNA polymerase sigma factor [Phototrophicaceae bacterium]